MWVNCSSPCGVAVLNSPARFTLLNVRSCCFDCRLVQYTVVVLSLWACGVNSRSCSAFFCRKHHRVSGVTGEDPGSPLFLTPYLEKGQVDEGK